MVTSLWPSLLETGNSSAQAPSCSEPLHHHKEARLSGFPTEWPYRGKRRPQIHFELFTKSSWDRCTMGWIGVVQSWWLVQLNTKGSFFSHNNWSTENYYATLKCSPLILMSAVMNQSSGWIRGWNCLIIPWRTFCMLACDECDCSSLLVWRNTDDGRSKQMEPVTIPSAGHHWLCTHRWASGQMKRKTWKKQVFCKYFTVVEDEQFVTAAGVAGQ